MARYGYPLLLSYICCIRTRRSRNFVSIPFNRPQKVLEWKCVKRTTNSESEVNCGLFLIIELDRHGHYIICIHLLSIVKYISYVWSGSHKNWRTSNADLAWIWALYAVGRSFAIHIASAPGKLKEWKWPACRKSDGYALATRSDYEVEGEVSDWLARRNEHAMLYYRPIASIVHRSFPSP